MKSIDLLDDSNIQRTIAVTLLQIKDYLHLLLMDSNEEYSELIESIHSTGALLMNPPVLTDSTIEMETENG